ncbi:MAG: hypothetical protein GC160_27425 [Acidobacteria bacterium]|nr:hypothetical protein [Acidobacteriota bacterium]
MAGFPSIAPRSLDIIVGSQALTPYQWAAKLAPPDQLIPYKNAMLWLEGEVFGSQEEFLGQVERILQFQQAVNHRPTATIAPPTGIGPEPDPEPQSGGGWSAVKTKPKAPRKPKVRLNKQQLAAAIVDGCIDELHRVYQFAGPSLRISDVYADFNSKEFTYPALIGAIRTEIQKLRTPSQCGFNTKTSARFWAESSAGKANNFNFKVQVPDKSKPNGWSAQAQIHVLWQ